jgi:2,3-bisphosphoglycerate-independent phosphoglycerate mutase
MKKSYELLSKHPINIKRVQEGKNPANSIWLWGEGTKPGLSPFEKVHGLKGGIISAVDLVKGIGLLAGMQIIDVPDITGNYDTNFAGKAEYAAKALIGGLDFVYIHMEGPDECGHHGDVEHKIYAIERIDQVVLPTLISAFTEAGEDYAILVTPDHPTPCKCKTHVSEPVPFLIYSNVKDLGCGATRYTEDEAAKTGVYVAEGHTLINKLLSIKR